MPGIRIYWEPPPDPDVAKYIINVQGINSGITFLGEVVHDLTGPNYIPAASRFFFDDGAGTYTTFYQVIAIAQSGVTISDTGLFQPAGPSAANTAARVRVDHNYPTPDNLRFVTASGTGIPDATIRVFKRPDFESGNTAVPLYTAATAGDGRWVRPLFLEPGFDYTLTFDKAYGYTSAPVNITV